MDHNTIQVRYRKYRGVVMETAEQRKATIGKRIRRLRHSRDLTLKELGAVLDLKGSQISNWEQGIRTPDLLNIEQMAKFFRVSPAYLAGFTSSEN
ncbi:MAG: helix-turn-helix domain-containing protein [Aeromonas veronii]